EGVDGAAGQAAAGVVSVGSDDHVGDPVPVEVPQCRGRVERGIERGGLRPTGDIGAVVEVERPHLVRVGAVVKSGVGGAAVEPAGAGYDFRPPVAVDVADGRAALERLQAVPLPDLVEDGRAVVAQPAEDAAVERVAGDAGVFGGVAAD